MPDMAKTPPPQTAADAVAKAPEPSDKGGKVVRCASPTHKFVVEGLPVVTQEGTRVTAEQFKTLSEAAEKQRPAVRLVEVEEGDK